MDIYHTAPQATKYVLLGQLLVFALGMIYFHQINTYNTVSHAIRVTCALWKTVNLLLNVCQKPDYT